MKVRVKVWGTLGIIPAFEGRGEARFEFHGHDVKDLIFQLFSRIDPEKRRIIFDDKDKISSDLVIILNERIVSGPSRFSHHLRAGDLVELVIGAG